MNKENGYTLLGYIPKKKSNKIKKNIIIVVITILIVLSLLFSLKIINNELKITTIPGQEKLSLEQFQPVYLNKTNGPITLDRDNDDGTKINIFEKILNNPDNELENYLYDEETLNSFPLETDIIERYLCEVGYGLTEDSSDSYEITCPMYYGIKIDKAYYGRYAKDAEHCITNYKGIKVNKTKLSPEFNCGKSVKNIVTEMCEGKSICNIAAGGYLFPDTCNNKMKYLHLKYHCVKNTV